MSRNKIIIIALACLIIAGGVIYSGLLNSNEITYTTLANSSIGTVEVGISGNANASKCIAIITGNPTDYDKGRANGEALVHDYVNPDVTSSDADAVIISHSHNPNYGEGFYVATPEMDDASVSIAEKISQTSDFNYYPVTGNETYKSTSAVLVSKPIAQAGYPTFVYEIPEDIWESTSTEKTKELFGLIANYID